MDVVGTDELVDWPGKGDRNAFLRIDAFWMNDALDVLQTEIVVDDADAMVLTCAEAANGSIGKPVRKLAAPCQGHTHESLRGDP